MDSQRVADVDQRALWREQAGYADCLSEEAARRAIAIREHGPRYIVDVEPPEDVADGVLKLAGVVILITMAVGMGLVAWL